MNDKIYRLSTVKERTGLPRSTIYDWMKKEKFPKSIPLGERCVGWLESDIQNWIEGQVQKRDERLKKYAQKRKNFFLNEKGGKA